MMKLSLRHWDVGGGGGGVVGDVARRRKVYFQVGEDSGRYPGTAKSELRHSSATHIHAFTHLYIYACTYCVSTFFGRIVVVCVRA